MPQNKIFILHGKSVQPTEKYMGVKILFRDAKGVC